MGGVEYKSLNFNTLTATFPLSFGSLACFMAQAYTVFGYEGALKWSITLWIGRIPAVNYCPWFYMKSK